MPSLKELKEAHVSGHAGTTLTEVNVLLLVMPLSTVLHTLTLARLEPCSRTVRFAGEFVMMMLPTLMVFTDRDWAVHALCLTTVVVALLLCFYRSAARRAARPDPRPGWLSDYRAWTMISTCICILAVDFNIFPRRFAKAETYGTGLMDVGVGAFVFNAGMVSQNQNSCRSRLKSALPMIALGLARLATVKGVDYQEHVSEYGVHWNFFFTIAGVVVLGPLVRPQNSLVLGCVACCAHQLLLVVGGWR